MYILHAHLRALVPQAISRSLRPRRLPMAFLPTHEDSAIATPEP